MFDLEKAIREWKKGFAKHESFEDGLIADMENNLRDAYDARRGEGLGDEEAFRQAVEQTGTAERIAAEYRKNRELALDRRTPWRPARFLPALWWNYLKTALRKFRRHKGHSATNITGLALGMACFTLIMLYVNDEMSYDTMHERGKRIFRVAARVAAGDENGFAVTPAPLAPAMQAELPEVSVATRFNPAGPLLFSADGKNLMESGLFADENFFGVFSFKIARGTKEGLLKNPNSIVISRSMAEKFFPQADPLGKVLNCSLGDLQITGIMEDFPKNSHIQSDWIIPLPAQFTAERRLKKLTQWNIDNYYTYFVLKEGVPIEQFADNFKTFAKNKYMAMVNATQKWWEVRANFQYIFQPLSDIHLHSHLEYELSDNGDARVIGLLAAISVFILLIACVNAMNLSSAQITIRMKEIGMRKVLGAQRRQLFWQFCGESLLMTGLAFVVALGIVFASLPWFCRFSEKTMPFADIGKWPFILIIPAVVILSGILSGAYPALLLSTMNPVAVLKAKSAGRRRKTGLRNVLVLFQFAIATALIITSMVVFKQIRFIQNKNIGYRREQILVMEKSDPGLRQNFSAFKQTLLADPSISSITTVDQLPISITEAGGAPLAGDKGRETVMQYYSLGADYNFIDAMGIKISRGRNFSRKFATDLQSAVIVNETFARSIGWSQPLGKRVVLLEENVVNEVVGVVKDFHFQSLHAKIEPLVMACRPDAHYILIRIRSGKTAAALKQIQRTFQRFREKYPFAYTFLDDEFNQMYKAESKLGEMLLAFSMLAIFIACLGIFGLATHAAERQAKGIGIRKILGASVPDVLLLFSREFASWVLIANIFAWPCAYYFMQNWLAHFAFRTSMGVGVFAASALISLSIALLAVSYQSIKAARANPVDSLRYE
jgi:putative ABC transport system permease protein